MLNDKAIEVRDALLEALVVKAREQNNDIISRYNSILTTIAEKPTNEADLAGLRGFISDSKEKVCKHEIHGVDFKPMEHSSIEQCYLPNTA